MVTRLHLDDALKTPDDSHPDTLYAGDDTQDVIKSRAGAD